MHWMRWNDAVTLRASVAAAVVFASPGTDSISTWPPVSSATSSERSSWCWPTTVDWNDCSTERMMRFARSSSSGVMGSRPGTAFDTRAPSMLMTAMLLAAVASVTVPGEEWASLNGRWSPAPPRRRPSR